MFREEGVSFQVIKTFKVSNDPDFEAKKNRVLELYDIADGKAPPGPVIEGPVRLARVGGISRLEGNDHGRGTRRALKRLYQPALPQRDGCRDIDQLVIKRVRANLAKHYRAKRRENHDGVPHRDHAFPHATRAHPS